MHMHTHKIREKSKNRYAPMHACKRERVIINVYLRQGSTPVVQPGLKFEIIFLFWSPEGWD